jgi:REP element-mobilizing transposase RayT
MQIIKSIPEKHIFREYLEIKKQLWSEELWNEELWNERGYIETVGAGTIFDVIKDCVENQENKEEKEAYKQMEILDF